MRWRCSAETQRQHAEESRQRRQIQDDEGLSEIAPASVEDLNKTDLSGNSITAFVFGLDNPFNASVRQLPAP